MKRKNLSAAFDDRRNAIIASPTADIRRWLAGAGGRDGPADDVSEIADQSYCIVMVLTIDDSTGLLDGRERDRVVVADVGRRRLGYRDLVLEIRQVLRGDR